MCLITSYVGHKNAIKLDVGYDSQLILPLLVKSLMLNAIEEPHVLGSQVDSKDLFLIVKKNPNTLKHFMSKKLNTLSLECELQVCLELVANEITQIPNYILQNTLWAF